MKSATEKLKERVRMKSSREKVINVDDIKKQELYENFVYIREIAQGLPSLCMVLGVFSIGVSPFFWMAIAFGTYSPITHPAWLILIGVLLTTLGASLPLLTSRCYLLRNKK